MGTDRQRRTLTGKTALVCGGSKGIGRATAARLVRLGANVGVVARDEKVLAETVSMLTALRADGGFVDGIVCDATSQEQFGAAADGFIQSRGVPDYLFNLVGSAYPQYAERLVLEDYRAAMESNYIGQLVPTLSLLPRFLERGSGHVALTSSALGFMGVMGYATYAPSKYAVIGLAEVLRNEYAHSPVGFSVLFPPDTDTPGFAIENQTKPEEWSATTASKLMQADDVAAAFVDGVLKGRFYIMPGQSALLWRMARYVPGVLHWYTDWEVGNARRRLGKA